MKSCWPLLLLLTIAACSRDPDTTAGSGSAAAPAGASRDAGPEGVAAVLQTSGGSPVALRFVLPAKPVVGAASSVRLDFSSAEAMPQLAVRVVGKGVSVDTAGGLALLDLPGAGQSASHTVTITPAAAGFSELLVNLRPSAEGAAEVTYAVPLLADAAAAPAAP